MMAKDVEAAADHPDTNHAQVLNSLDQAGYIVKFQKVDPVTVGVPMSRSRLRYQGMLKTIPFAQDQMNFMNDMWKRLIDVTDYKQFELKDFLIGDVRKEDSAREKCSKQEPAGHERKWRALRKDTFAEYQAGVFSF